MKTEYKDLPNLNTLFEIKALDYCLASLLWQIEQLEEDEENLTSKEKGTLRRIQKHFAHIKEIRDRFQKEVDPYII